MKAPLPRHERESSHSMLCVIFLLCVLVSAITLGSLRLYGLYLEHRLADVTMRIEEIGDRNAILEERYSALLSPSRIYTYAKSELKMIAASEVKTITVGEKPGRFARRHIFEKDSPRHARAQNPITRFFVGRANAKD